MQDSTRARAELDEVERLGDAVERSTRWYAWYLLVFGLGTVIAVSTVGVVRGPVSAAAWALVWTAFVTAMGLFAMRQPVKRHGLTRVHFLTLVAMFAALMPVLVLGVTAMAGRWWWYPATAPLVALPFFIGAYYWARRR